MSDSVRQQRLILEIEVPDFNVDGAQEAADEFCDGDLLFIVLEKWMRCEVGETFVTLPSEKSQNHEFEIESRTCWIVGARIGRVTSSTPVALRDALISMAETAGLLRLVPQEHHT